MRPKKLCLVIAAAATLAQATFALLPDARADLLDLLGLDGEFTQDDLAAGLADCQEHEACVTVCGRHCYGEHLEGNPAAIKAIDSAQRCIAAFYTDLWTSTDNRFSTGMSFNVEMRDADDDHCRKPEKLFRDYHESCLSGCEEGMKQEFGHACYEECQNICSDVDEANVMDPETQRLEDECRALCNIKDNCLATDESYAYNVTTRTVYRAWNTHVTGRAEDLQSGDPTRTLKWRGTPERERVRKALQDPGSAESMRLEELADILENATHPGRPRKAPNPKIDDTISPADPRWTPSYEAGAYADPLCDPFETATHQPQRESSCLRFGAAMAKSQRALDEICGPPHGRGCPNPVTWREPYYEEHRQMSMMHDLKLAKMELKLLNSTATEHTRYVEEAIAALSEIVADLHEHVEYMNGPAGEYLAQMGQQLHDTGLADAMKHLGDFGNLFEEQSERAKKGESISLLDIMEERGLAESKKTRAKTKERGQKAEAAMDEMGEL